MKLRYAAASTLFTSAIFIIACGGSNGGGVLPIGPGNGNNEPTPSAGYLGGAVIQKSKLQLPGASLGTPDENTEVGETVACMNEVGELTHLEVYEYYEARELTSANISLGTASDDPWVRVADTFNKINHLDPILVKNLISLSESLKASMRLLPSAKLLSYPMRNSVITLPANCYLLQAAMMNNNGYQSAFLVDKTIWEAMNSDQKTGLILHETLKLHYNVKFLVAEESDGGGSSRPRIPGHPDFDYRSKMDHRGFRQTHINFVDIATGFRNLSFTNYLLAIGQQGQTSINIGGLFYQPSHIEFYNVDERKVKKGYLAQGGTISSPSPIFKDLTVSGEVSFYENGKLKTATVGRGQTSTSNGVPNQMDLYQNWPLSIGGNGLLNGTASFDENGQFLGIDYGFLYQKIAIKTDMYDLTVDENTSDTSGGRIYISEVQSFNFMTANPYCRSCSGSITPNSTVNPRITFANAAIKKDGMSGTQEISSSSQPIAFNLPDGTKLRGNGTLVIDLNGKVTSIDHLEGFNIICESRAVLGRIVFDEEGKIKTVDGQPICADYKIVAIGA